MNKKIQLIEDDGVGAMFDKFLEEKHGKDKVEEKKAELEGQKAKEAKVDDQTSNGNRPQHE